ncbi:hypothetical protein ACHAXR_012283 [Thalassiosira sp. AJA248-18]
MKRLRRAIYTPTNLNSKILQRVRENDCSLTRVIFSSRNLGHQGVTILTQALQSNTNLAALDLSSNSIESEGAHSVALLLQHQTMMARGGGIRTLILGDNNLRDDGVKSMADALAKNIMLENLSIDDNCIGASGLALLADALRSNTSLRRLHLRHNSFQSLSPLITCTFDRRSLDSVADSNHTLKHVFLNCGYSYECEELEVILKINRTMGQVEARWKKIALYLEEDLGRLLNTTVDIMDTNVSTLPRLLALMAQHGTISGMFHVMQSIPSEILYFQGISDDTSPMEVDDNSMDVEYLSC